jgi:hypothetical protein
VRSWQKRLPPRCPSSRRNAGTQRCAVDNKSSLAGKRALYASAAASRAPVFLCANHLGSRHRRSAASKEQAQHIEDRTFCEATFPYGVGTRQEGPVARQTIWTWLCQELWFWNVNLHHDLLSLTNQHTSAWDTWRSAATRSKHLDDPDLAFSDRIAMMIEMAEQIADGLLRLGELTAFVQRPPWIDRGRVCHFSLLRNRNLSGAEGRRTRPRRCDGLNLYYEPV